MQSDAGQSAFVTNEHSASKELEWLGMKLPLIYILRLTDGMGCQTYM